MNKLKLRIILAIIFLGLLSFYLQGYRFYNGQIVVIKPGNSNYVLPEKQALVRTIPLNSIPGMLDQASRQKMKINLKPLKMTEMNKNHIIINKINKNPKSASDANKVVVLPVPVVKKIHREDRENIFFEDYPQRKAILVRKLVKRYVNIDEKGRKYVQIAGKSKKWYICSICGKGYSYLIKFDDKWVCENCWVEAWQQKNRRTQNYIMKRY